MRQLKVCGMENPMGLDILPVFSWIPDGTERDAKQSSYRIFVASAEELAKDGYGDIWDSGVVQSSRFSDIAYEGPALRSKTTYFWIAESHCGVEVQKSEICRFHTGILTPDEWKGQWIGAGFENRHTLSGAYWIWLQTDSEPENQLVRYFRRCFQSAGEKAVKKITIGVKANDSAEIYINGILVGETNYRYTGSLIDITDYVQNGKNAVAICTKNTVDGCVGLIAKIEIQYMDGTVENIVSDHDWRATDTKLPQWTEIDCDDGDWAVPEQVACFGEKPWGKHISLETEKDRAAVLLRRDFTLEKQISEAYAYICGLGFFELTINGSLPDESVLNPFITQYNKRILYRTFCVTSLLKQGENAVGVELGNSFYNELGGVWNWATAKWRDHPKLLMNLEIRYADGSRETIVTDSKWSVSTEGPIISNSLYYGEIYDARKEQTDWNKVGFDDEAWTCASLANVPTGILSSQLKAPVGEVAEIPLENIRRLENGSYILTLREMTAGWAFLKNIREDAGHLITITYGQILNDDGSVRRYGGPDGEIAFWWPHAYIQQDRYICKGTGCEFYKPKFSYKGHLYIQIDGYSGELTAKDVSIYRVSNEAAVISEFNCSDNMFNQLHHMMRRAMTNNFQGEHCDPVLEKNGWTGDANVSIGSLAYNFEISRTLPAWIQAMGDCLDQYDLVPVMVPTADWCIDNGAVWNTLYVYGVEYLEKHFGMSQYAKHEYAGMRRYTIRQVNELKENGWVWYDNQLGDWVAPIGGRDSFVQYNESISEGSGITGTAMLYGILRYMKKLALTLGKEEDAGEYASAMDNIYRAFQEAFFKPEEGYYQTGFWRQIGTRTRYRQTDNLMALSFDLVPKQHIDTVLKNLICDIRNKDYHLDTGCVGTRYILPVLCDCGYANIAYKIARQTTYPSWGFWVENGASSTWEMWESSTRSYDHYFLGTYEEWFYTHLAGICDVENGYASFSIKPVFFQALNKVNCSIDTPRGKLSVDWERKEKNLIQIDITIPFGSEALIFLPADNSMPVSVDGDTVSLDAAAGIKEINMMEEVAQITAGSGAYSFSFPFAGIPCE